MRKPMTFLLTGVVCAGMAAPLAAQSNAGAAAGAADVAQAIEPTKTSTGGTSAQTSGSVASEAALSNPSTESLQATRNVATGGDDNATTVGELIGETITNATGDAIGEIDDVVSIRGEAMAIVGVGGFFGIGERDVAVPVTELAIGEDSVEAPGYTLDQLKSMREYRTEAATPLKTNEPIRLGRL